MRGDIMQLERLANAIGVTQAIRLCLFFGPSGTTLYVPEEATPGHTIERVIGKEAFAYLVDSFGGETISVPTLESLTAIEREGWVFALSKRGVPKHQIARLLGIGERNTHRLLRELEADGLINQGHRNAALKAQLPPVLVAAGELRRRVQAALEADSKLTRATRSRAGTLLERAEKLLSEAAGLAGLGQTIMAGAACGAIEQAEALMQKGTVHA